MTKRDCDCPTCTLRNRQDFSAVVAASYTMRELDSLMQAIYEYYGVDAASVFFGEYALVRQSQ